MKTLLYILIVAVAVKLPSAQAAICTDKTSNKCVATLYTRENCNTASKICDCNIGYVPVYTGCAIKPITPYVRVDDVTRDFIVAPGKNMGLVCNTTDTASAGVTMTFEWKLNNTIIPSVTTQIYSITSADATKVGTFSCKVIFRTKDSTLESDYSNNRTITLLSNTSNFSPGLTITFSAELNANLKPTCNGIPYGVTYTFQLSNNRSVVPPFIFTADMLGLTIKCIMDSIPGIVFSKTASPPENMPKNNDGYVLVEIKYLSSTYELLEFYTGTSVTLTCLPMKSEYLDPSKPFTYKFADSKNPSPVVNGNNYTVTPATGEHTVSCNATYNGNIFKSAPRTVTFTDSYKGLPTPVLRPEGDKATVGVGSRLVLYCGDVPTTQNPVIYTWTKDGLDIFRQNDRIIQIGSFVGSDAGSYQCQARVDNYITRSNTVVIISHATTVISSVLLLAGAAWISIFM